MTYFAEKFEKISKLARAYGAICRVNISGVTGCAFELHTK